MSQNSQHVYSAGCTASVIGKQTYNLKIKSISNKTD